MEKKQAAVTMMVSLVGLFIGYALHSIQLEKKFTELEITINSSQTQIDKLKAQIDEQERKLAEKDEAIEVLTGQAEELNAKLKRVSEKLSEKDRIIEVLTDQFGSGFEDSYRRDSSHLGGEMWDSVDHIVQVYSGLDGEWGISRDESHSGRWSLKFKINDPASAERTQVNLKIWQYFGNEIYVSMWYKLPSLWEAKYFYILAELARETPFIGPTELAIELGFWKNPESNDEWWFVLQKRDLQRDIYVNGKKEKYIYYREFLHPIILGEWFHVEWYLRRHSTNGEVRVWIDGNLLADRRNEMTKTQDYYYISAMRIYTSTDSPFPQYLWGDDLVIRIPKQGLNESIEAGG